VSSRNRLLVIDENLTTRLAGELRDRGREARSFGQLGLRGATDPDALRRLFALFPDCVLVTGDDSMPAEHADVIAQVRATLATIDPDRPAGYVQDQWERDVVHRWAHAMQVQGDGLIRRYSLGAHRVWAPRLRKPHRR
jgi:hypothetical protein